MPFRSPRPRDVEKAQQVVRFVDEPRSSTDSDLAARPHVLGPPTGGGGSSRRRSWRARLVSPEAIPWLLTCVFATTTILLLWERPESRRFGSYETRFSSDLKSLNQVPLEVRRFRGSPDFDANGTMRTPPATADATTAARWPENHRFVGGPSAEVDDSWAALLEGRYFSVSEDEAAAAWGDRRREYVDEERGGYTAGLDVFHTLHCVNELRMALYPEHYPDHGVAAGPHAAAHVDHCLDALRQHVQCYGSTTLVPTRWRDAARRQYIDSDQEHVCRDLSYLRRFVTRRGPEGDLYVERDRSLVSKWDGEGGDEGEGQQQQQQQQQAAGELKAVEGQETGRE